jgi:hypothetical protein
VKVGFCVEVALLFFASTYMGTGFGLVALQFPGALENTKPDDFGTRFGSAVRLATIYFTVTTFMVVGGALAGVSGLVLRRASPAAADLRHTRGLFGHVHHPGDISGESTAGRRHSRHRGIQEHAAHLDALHGDPVLHPVGRMVGDGGMVDHVGAPMKRDSVSKSATFLGVVTAVSGGSLTVAPGISLQVMGPRTTIQRRCCSGSSACS